MRDLDVKTMRDRPCLPLMLMLSLLTAGVPVRAEGTVPKSEAAAGQRPQPWPASSPSPVSSVSPVLSIPDASRAFEEDVYPSPQFLPPEIYHRPEFEEELYEAGTAPGVQLMQYPTIDSAARDEDPAGLEPGSWWNPIPFISGQLASIPQEEHGLISQEVSVTDTVLVPSGNSYSMNTVDVRSTLYFGQFPILRLTPRFGWHVVGDGGPVGMPPQFFDAGLDATLYLPLGKKWSFLGMVGPSIFSDGENTSSQAFRFTGRAMAFYQWSEAVKLAGGFLYLDRADIKALPAGGVFYQPHDDLKVEIFFPRPRIAWRFFHDMDLSTWGYLAGEFGGNSWAIERTGGMRDTMTLRDYRLVAGIEHLNGEEFRCLVEAGFVFGRKIEYTSNLGNTTQSPTAMLRGGFAF